jgi:hypothetical protein
MRGSTHLVYQSVVMQKTVDEARAMATVVWRDLLWFDRVVEKLHRATARRQGESVTPMYVATNT